MGGEAAEEALDAANVIFAGGHAARVFRDPAAEATYQRSAGVQEPTREATGGEQLAATDGGAAHAA